MKVCERDYRTAARVHRERMEKQIGCMSGFLHIFDRQQILAGKRIHSSKRLPPSPAGGASPEFSQSSSSDNSQTYPAENMIGRPKPPATFNHTSVADGDENHQISTSVIARLMGLEPMSSSDQKPPLTVTKPILRRSVSEHRISNIDENNFQLKQPNKSQKSQNNQSVELERSVRVRKSTEYESVNLNSESSRTSTLRLRDSTDFFPERNQKTKGIDDISTLKQILQVLQLKGLLRSTTHSHSNRDRYRNFVYDQNLYSDENSIIVMKPSQSSTSKVEYQRSLNDSRRTRRYFIENRPAIVDRNGRSHVRTKIASPNRTESNLKSCNSIRKRKPLNIESSGSLKSSSTDSPKRTGSVIHHSVINRSPRNQKPTASSSNNNNSQKQKFVKKVVTEDESASISESIASTSFTTDSERCRDGKSSLQRCEKLLHSVAETNNITESPSSSATVLRSPVSVLDSGLANDVMLTRSLNTDLKATSSTKSTECEEFTSDDSDFIYISKIVRASKYLKEDSNLFFSIEKQLHNTQNTLNVSKSQRKLVFDIVLEILDKNRQLPPRKTLNEDFQALVKKIWFEFRKIREIRTGDCVLEVVSGIVEKDLVEIRDWRDYPIETSKAILHIERMIFKDLVSEAIRDLAEFSNDCKFLRTRRRLVF